MRQLRRATGRAACAWTWPGVFPEADPGAVLVRHDTPNVSTAVVVWYDVAPDVGVFLAGQFLISTSRIWFASMRGGVGLSARLPRWPLSPTSDRPAIVIGEVHHPVTLTESPRASQVGRWPRALTGSGRRRRS